MNTKLLIFETHPIQYRAPVFQALERINPGQFEVVYASDFSVRGYKDKAFGTNVAWDTPLMTGYRHRVLGNEKSGGIDSWSGMTAKGVDRIIGEVRPAAIMLSSLSYAYSWGAYWGALRRRIPVWIRIETQDESLPRGQLKGVLRSLVYRAVYSGVSRAFYIGKLNRDHLLKHGMSALQLDAAHYCVANLLADASDASKQKMRDELRASLSIGDGDLVISFFGKLIEKKDPAIILQSLARLDLGSRQVHCVFVGSGELQQALRAQAADLEKSRGVRTIFTGFVNQSQLPAYYLASDIAVLPSRRMGETWGLVVNEALQAGCAAVVSNVVGCHKDFSDWERVRVFPQGDAEQLTVALKELAAFPRELNWARERMKNYSVESAASAIARTLDAMPEPGNSGAPLLLQK